MDSLGSDHLPICTKLQLHPARTKTLPHHNWDKADWDAFSQHLVGVPPPYLRNFHTAYRVWLRQLNAATDLAVPVTTRRQHPSPWLSRETRALITERNQAQARGDTAAYGALCSQVNEAIALAKRQIFEDRIADCSSNIWPLIKQLDNSGFVNKSTAIKSSSGKSLSSDKDIANEFAKTYALRSKNPTLSFQGNKQARRDVLVPAKKVVAEAASASARTPPPQISMSELDTHINRLPPTGSPGPDNIHNQAIKHLPPNHRHFLLGVINASLATGQLPHSWRQASIIPIPKPGKELNSTGSYRPIALTSCLAKLVERVVLHHLLPHLEPNIHPNQAGFRPSRSTDDHLAWFTQEVIDGQGRSQPTVAAFLDLSAAFDVAWRPAIILKLQELGTPPPPSKLDLNFSLRPPSLRKIQYGKLFKAPLSPRRAPG